MKAQADFYGGPWDGERREITPDTILEIAVVSEALVAAGNGGSLLMGHYVFFGFSIGPVVKKFEWRPA